MNELIEMTNYKRVYVNTDTAEVVDTKWQMVKATIHNLFHYGFWSPKWETVTTAEVSYVTPLFN